MPDTVCQDAHPSQSASARCGGVACVVLNWNGLEETRACCRMVTPLLGHEDQLLIVDNGSTTHDVAALRAACPEATVLTSGKNLGFAGGVNLAIRQVLAQSPDMAYIWLLNNDMQVVPETLKALLGTLDRSPRTGIAGADMPDGFWRLSPSLRMPLPVKAGRKPDYISGACMLVRREVFAEIGLFDDDYFFFFEDADFCLRARAAGWSLAVAARAGAHHVGGATIRRDLGARARLYRAGHRRFLRKTVRVADARGFICLLWRLFVELVQGNVAAIRGNLAGWREGRELPVGEKRQERPQ